MCPNPHLVLSSFSAQCTMLQRKVWTTNKVNGLKCQCLVNDCIGDLNYNLTFFRTAELSCAIWKPMICWNYSSMAICSCFQNLLMREYGNMSQMLKTPPTTSKSFFEFQLLKYANALESVQEFCNLKRYQHIVNNVQFSKDFMLCSTKVQGNCKTPVAFHELDSEEKRYLRNITWNILTRNGWRRKALSSSILDEVAF